MWILASKHNPELRHVLLCGRDYVLGRKDADIVLENDMSISRKHAILRGSHPEQNVMNTRAIPILAVQDLSKLGTAIGEERLVRAKGVINNGDVVWFGNLTADNSQFKAIYQSYIVTTSCLDAAAKKSTRQLLMRLGGHVINDWRKECDVLVMSNLSITIKAICALIGQKPIVKPQYLDDLVKNLEGGVEAPNTERYLPPLAESQLDPRAVSFKPNPLRQTIFQGFLFIFLTSKQFKKLSVAIEAGGGTPMLLEEGTDDEDDILVAPGSCVMSCDVSDQSQLLSKNARGWIEHVMKTLEKHKKRAIQESEVGFAVLYCSTDTNCNPSVESNNGAPSVPVVPQTLSQNVGSLEVDHHTDTGAHSTVTSITRNEAENVKFSSRKRGRPEETEDVETPSKKTRGATRRNTPPSNHNAEDNNNVKTGTRHHRNETEISPEPEINEKKAVGKRSMQNKSRSPSPAPYSPKQTRMNLRNSPSPPPPVGARGISGKATTKCSPQTTKECTSRQLKQDPFQDGVSSSRMSRARMTYSSDEGGVNSDDEFAAIPKRKGRRKREHSPNSDVVDFPKRMVKKEPDVTIIDDSEGMPVPGQRSGPPKKDEDNSTPFKIKSEPQSSADPGPSCSQHRGRMVEGFVGRENRGEIPVDDAFIDTDIKPLDMLTEERSLVVRKPGETTRIRPDMSGDTAKWKGREVKNFKKFHKVAHAGSHTLPEIIGGTDLQTHINTQRQGLDDWFKEYLDRESQEQELASQREADNIDFLNYDPRHTSGKSKKGRR